MSRKQLNELLHIAFSALLMILIYSQHNTIKQWSKSFDLVYEQNRLIMEAKNKLPNSCITELDRRVLKSMGYPDRSKTIGGLAND